MHVVTALDNDRTGSDASANDGSDGRSGAAARDRTNDRAESRADAAAFCSFFRLASAFCSAFGIDLNFLTVLILDRLEKFFNK